VLIVHKNGGPAERHSPFTKCWPILDRLGFFGLDLNSRLLSFTIIYAVFLHDLASAYQISSKWNHSRQSYDVISISRISKIATLEMEIHPRLRFNDSTRLAMSKSI